LARCFILIIQFDDQCNALTRGNLQPPGILWAKVSEIGDHPGGELLKKHNLRVLLTCFDSRRESHGGRLNSGKMQLD
jgi:hypothetical protein